MSTRLRVRLAVTASASAALMHVSASVAHYREWWLFCALFAIAAAPQFAWAALAWRGASTLLLAAGAALNFGVACVWFWSRTRGLPIGPDAFQPEAIGVADTQTTVDELLATLLVATVLCPPFSARLRHLAYTLELLTLFAVGASFLALASGAGHDG